MSFGSCSRAEWMYPSRKLLHWSVHHVWQVRPAVGNPAGRGLAMAHRGIPFPSYRGANGREVVRRDKT